ncbi:isochorismatase family protein [Chelativorans sp.]|uniref:isochorismatase family protein n=1 Tax=Chelativorans sp. TaxID=2203393 RepID=UPI002812056C|nr:isochorismatase family protein [Chelativorans sp.]
MRRPLSIDKAKAAALFVDLQEEHRQDARYLVAGFDTLIANVRKLQEVARAGGVPVLHSAYVLDGSMRARRPLYPVKPDGTPAFSERGSPLSEICPEVGPVGGEPVLIKSEASAFGDGRLAELLHKAGVEWLFIAGVWTEACIDATVKHAVDGGFRVILVKDACSSATSAMHKTAILNIANRLYGGAVTDTNGACRLLLGERIEAWQVVGSVPLRFTFQNADELYRQL